MAKIQKNNKKRYKSYLLKFHKNNIIKNEIYLSNYIINNKNC